MPKRLHPRLLLLLQLILPLLLLANSGTLAQQQEEQPKEVPSPNEGGVAAAEQSPSVAAATLLEEDQQQQQQSKCGTKETDFAPCVGRERADEQFKHCCSQYVPAGCQPLCQYEPDELTARNMLLQAVKSKKCDLKHFGTILYCASQNQDNRKCCQHLNLADSKLGVGERCLRFCDPGGGPGIESIARADVTCLFNWNVLMYCHHSGIKLVA